MFKTKYKLFNYLHVLEDSLTDLFEEESRKGWHITKFGGTCLKFKKGNPKDIKYSLDYIIPDDEYKEILSQQGYEYIDNLQSLFLYRNNNIHADEIHTDNLTKYQAIKDCLAPTRNIYLSILVIFLTAILSSHIFSKVFMYPFVLGSIYKYLSLYLTSLFFIMFILFFILYIISQICMKVHLNKLSNNENGYLKQNQIINKLMNIFTIIFLLVSAVVSIVILQTNPKIIITLVLSFLVISIYSYFINKLVYRISDDFKRKISTILVVIIFFITHFAVQNIEFEKQELPLLIKPYMDNYSFKFSEENFLTTDYTLYGRENNNDNFTAYEDYSVCLNNHIAKKIFESNIIYLDSYLKNNMNLNDLFWNNHSIWFDEKFTFRSYDNIITSLQEHKNSLIDKCYYNDMFTFILKDNKVLVTYTNNNIEHIDNIIEHYFKGEI